LGVVTMAETETPPAGGTVHVPGIGPMKKKNATYAAVGGLALVLLYIVVRKRQSSAAATTAPAGATVTDPDGNVCSALAPSGYCPGTPGDLAAQQSASAGVFGPTGQQPGVSVSGDGTTPNTGPGSFTNNAQWAAYAEQGMGSTGADAIAAALGKYVTGGQVTADQIVSIDEAIAIAGYPPTQGPGGKPPSINQVEPGPAPTPTGNVNGTVTGLKVTSVGTTTARISWNATKGAKGYDVAEAGYGTYHTTGTSYSFSHLVPKKHYTIDVAAKPSISGHATVSFTTK
jgi:hypothetical protein